MIKISVSLKHIDNVITFEDNLVSRKNESDIHHEDPIVHVVSMEDSRETKKIIFIFDVQLECKIKHEISMRYWIVWNY